MAESSPTLQVQRSFQMAQVYSMLSVLNYVPAASSIDAIVAEE